MDFAFVKSIFEAMFIKFTENNNFLFLLGHTVFCLTLQTEYDGYIAWLLDNQSSQQHLLREQVDLMSARGTSRPHEMSQVSEHLAHLTDEAKAQLNRNQKSVHTFFIRLFIISGDEVPVLLNEIVTAHGIIC